MKSIRGKTAMVTGASSGIGRAIAVALAREGARVCLVGRDEARLKDTANEAAKYGVEAIVMPCDLADPAQVAELAQAALSRLGQIDILINSAGVAHYGHFDFMDQAKIDRILSTNLLAPVRLVRELLPGFLARREAHIVNVSSIFGLITMRKGAAYQTTKFALVGFSEALRAEHWRNGIGVTTLCPGFVRTPMLDTFEPGSKEYDTHRVPDAFCLTAEQVAETAIRAIYKDKGLVVTPFWARAVWRLMRLSPGLFDWLMCQRWRKRRLEPAGR